MENIYKKKYREYISKGYVVTPDKYGSQHYALKGLNIYANKSLNLETAKTFAENPLLVDNGSNIALLLGESSGVIALDLDTDNPEILDKIKHLLPESPVEKRGSKGYTRFFRYTGERTEVVHYNKKVVLEILSTGKKTTIPPSIHPNGATYVWTSEKELLDVNKEDLPVLPPFLVSEITRILGADDTQSYGKVINGRNSALSNHVGKLINENLTVDSILTELIKFDKDNSDTPYFTDPNEHYTTDAATNALAFYSSHLTSINSKRLRENKEYITPVMQSSVDIEKLQEEARKKSLAVGAQKKLKDIDYSLAPTAIKTLSETLNKNSWVPQANLAMGASLAVISALSSRKFQFEGSSPNVYIGAISKSGTGKNSGMEFIKNTMIDLRAENLLGSADIPSEAGLMDSLTIKPQMVLPLDEIGGILKSAVSGSSDYNSKLGDLLCELYTTSSGRFLGRALVEGTRGAVDRPNLTIYGATTPRGFQDSINRSAIQKGLLGRFLLFFGHSHIKSKRISSVEKLPDNIYNQLLYLASYTPPETSYIIQDRPQRFQEITATKDASDLLDKLFSEYDDIRLNNLDDDFGPIAARLYQQMIKIVMLSAIASSNRDIPQIKEEDVVFGDHIIKTCFHNFKVSIKDFLFDSQQERARWEVYKVIRDKGLITKSDLFNHTAHIIPSKRKDIINDLLNSDKIEVVAIREGEEVKTFYKDKVKYEN